MKIAVINEVSQRAKNKAIIDAVRKLGYEPINFAMTPDGDEPELSYIHTGLMTGLVINSGVCEYVIGGCGTGQGYNNTALLFPNVVCGVIEDPLDAWLFRQINGGNVLSLSLAKGYGWAGEINVEWILERFFKAPCGGGFPAHRKDAQKAYRDEMKNILAASKKPMEEILKEFPIEPLKSVYDFPEFIEKISVTDAGKAYAKIISDRIKAEI